MKARWVVVLLVMALAALGCNLPVATGALTGTPDPNASQTPNLFTLAAQTAIAYRTGTAAAQAGDTPPAQPTWTLEPGAPTPAPLTATSQPCDAADFVQDVTIPDGTRLAPGQSFTKTWRLRNSGTCAWSNAYAMVFAGGDAMGAPAVINLPGAVPAGATVDLSIDMKAPGALGSYEGNWKLRSASGAQFGVYGNQPFYVQIEVAAPTPTVTVTPTITLTPTVTLTQPAPPPSSDVYNFVSAFCQAEWRSQGGSLNCPGLENDPKGFALRPKDAPRLENNAAPTTPVLLTAPDATKNGAITGRYPAQAIQAGQRFQASVGCVSGMDRCKVIIQVNISTGSGDPRNLIEVKHTYGGALKNIDLDLSEYAGKNAQIILVVLADGSAEDDVVAWVNPRIIKP